MGIYILLLDMSKAFDTLNRKNLFDGLEQFLNPDELYLFGIITKEPKLQVKIEQSLGQLF